MTVTFQDLKFEPHINGENDKDIHAKHAFGNGYSASIIRTSYSYGGLAGWYELAVFHGDHIVYDTPITSDVLGWLTEDDVTDALKRIEALPERETV